MKLMLYLSRGLQAFLFVLAGLPAQAAEIRVAVTSDFIVTMEELKSTFEQNSTHTVTLVPGNSATLYSRINNGEDFDFYFAEGSARPEVLEQLGRIVPNGRFTYARGKLALWSLENRRLNQDTLSSGEFDHLALADPRLDLYGRSSMQALQALGLWDSLQDKIVLGENIAQTYHFAISGDVDLALVAFSQLVYGKYMQAGGYWEIPPELYPPIDQQAVMLDDDPADMAFMEFIRSEWGRAIIRNSGYALP